MSGLTPGQMHVNFSPSTDCGGNFSDYYMNKTAGYYTFNLNGGSCTESTDERKITLGEAYGTLPTPTREGYTFDGWYDAETGGTPIKSTVVFNRVDNPTLYAHWTATADATPVASYHHSELRYYQEANNDGKNNYETLDFSVLKTDYSNSDWYKSPSSELDTGSSYVRNNQNLGTTTGAQGSDRVLWRSNTLGKNATCIDWYYITLTAPSYTKVTYNITNGPHIQHSTANCNETRIAFLDFGTDYDKWISRSQDPNGNTTFHTAHINGASDNNKNKYLGETAAVYTCTAKSGDSFQDGYYTYTVDNSNGGVQKSQDFYGAVSSSQTWWSTSSTATSIYYLWNPSRTITYCKYITYEANDGTSTSQSQTIETSGNLSAPTYTRTGYTFAGWNTKADGTGTAHTNGQTISVDVNSKGALPLYAQWKSNATIGGEEVTPNTEVTLTDGKDLVISKNDVTVSSISYKRENMTNNWGTICLPFAVTSDANVQYYTLKEVDLTQGIMSFEKVGSVAANTPAVFKRLSSNDLSVSAGETTLSATIEKPTSGTWTLIGTFTEISRMPEGYFFNSDKFWYTDYTHYPEAVSIPAYRCYFTTTTSGNAKASFNLMAIDGDSTTQIGTIDAEGKVNFNEGAAYNLAGQKVSNSAKGIIIINGKKIIK